MGYTGGLQFTHTLHIWAFCLTWIEEMGDRIMVKIKTENRKMKGKAVVNALNILSNYGKAIAAICFIACVFSLDQEKQRLAETEKDRELEFMYVWTSDDIREIWIMAVFPLDAFPLCHSALDHGKLSIPALYCWIFYSSPLRLSLVIVANPLKRNRFFIFIRLTRLTFLIYLIWTRLYIRQYHHNTTLNHNKNPHFCLSIAIDYAALFPQQSSQQKIEDDEEGKNQNQILWVVGGEWTEIQWVGWGRREPLEGWPADRLMIMVAVWCGLLRRGTNHVMERQCFIMWTVGDSLAVHDTHNNPGTHTYR